MGVDTKAFTKGLAGARAELAMFGRNMSTIGLALGGVGAIGAFAFHKVVMAASNLEEQTDRARDEFGKYSGYVIEQSKLMATAFGVSKKSFLSTASVIAAMLDQAGYAGDAIAKMSVQLVKTTLDMSRYVDVSQEMAIEDIKSGLAGHPISLLKYGVNLKQVNLQQYAFMHGITKTNTELTEEQKVMATLGLIQERTAKMAGNLAKTGDKVAGAVEAVKGRFENLGATIGDSFLLMAAGGLMEVQLGLQALETYWVNTGKAALASSEASITGLQGQHAAMGPLQDAIGTIADIWQFVQEGFLLFQGVVLVGVRSIIGVLDKLESALVVIGNVVPGTNFKKSGFLKVMYESMDDLVKAQGEAFKKVTHGPWAHEFIDQSFDKARKDIQDARDKLKAQGAVDLTKFTPKPPALSGKEHKGFASAQLFGSQEAASTILRSTYGAMTRGPADRTAENTAKANVLLQKLVDSAGSAALIFSGGI